MLMISSDSIEFTSDCETVWGLTSMARPEAASPLGTVADVILVTRVPPTVGRETLEVPVPKLPLVLELVAPLVVPVFSLIATRSRSPRSDPLM
jgi:hypothetical protein